MSDSERRIQALEEALKPLVLIADQYDADGLDEARPCWVNNGTKEFNMDEELYCGRGGKRLLTLGDCLLAREVVTGQKYVPPDATKLMLRAMSAYNAWNVGGPTWAWEMMSEERRTEFIARFAKWEKEKTDED